MDGGPNSSVQSAHIGPGEAQLGALLDGDSANLHGVGSEGSWYLVSFERISLYSPLSGVPHLVVSDVGMSKKCRLGRLGRICRGSLR